MAEKDLTEETKEQTEATEDEVTSAEEAPSSDTEVEEADQEEASEEETEDPVASKSDSPDTEKKKTKKKKDKKDEQIEELNDRLMRQRAEFENFRKRSEKEKSQMFEVGAKSTLEKILPVVDNFERGLVGMEDSEEPFAQGMNMIYKQLLTSLEEIGVTPIDAVGKEFDPEYHNAVMHIDDEAYGESEVVEVLQKGYLYRDGVLRHAMVKVAN